jgi:hypothetical protein
MLLVVIIKVIRMLFVEQFIQDLGILNFIFD